MKLKLFTVLSLAFAMSFSLLPTNQAIASENQEPNVTVESETKLLETTYQTPISRAVTASVEEETYKVILTEEEINNMSREELRKALSELTTMNEVDIETYVNEYKGNTKLRAAVASSIAPTQPYKSWYVEPHMTSRQRWASYTTNWVGIDAYRSGVGMTKGTETSWTIAASIGYEGSADIKAWSNTFQTSFSTEYTMTISESVECPAWWTVNWRPYILYYVENWEGTIKNTVYLPATGGGLAEQVTYSPVSGTNKSLITKSTETWSRENVNRDVNAATPLPPQDASTIFGN